MRLADGGAALEFAIGTGRVAVPLAEKGVSVTGIELSRPMVERLRTKVDEATPPWSSVTWRPLSPLGGRFVIELWVPEVHKLPPDRKAVVLGSGPGHISLDTYDVLTQHVVSHRIPAAR